MKQPMQQRQWPDGVGRFEIELAKGELMRQPASTKHLIYGPQKLIFERFEDRGITVTLLD